MIKGLGIDAVDIARFVPWTKYSRTRLSRIFSQAELDYCFAQIVIPAQAGIQASNLASNLATIAQRLAVRFAAREAFFKALSTFDPAHTVPFLTVCQHVAVTKQPSGAISLSVDWSSLKEKGLALKAVEPVIHISATHTATTAFVTVIIEAIND